MGIQRFDTRQSMENKRFEVFHYRDHRHQFVGMHHHDFYELYFFLNGEVTFQVEDKSYEMQPGDLLLINPRELHRVTGQSDRLYERIVLWLDPDYLTELEEGNARLTGCFTPRGEHHNNLIRPSQEHRAHIAALLEGLTTEYHSEREDSDLYAKGLLLQLMVEVNRLAIQNAPINSHQEQPDLVSQVLAYIGDHYQQPLTLESLANVFFVSKYHLSHAFSRRVGVGVYRYILLRRLLEARTLLAAGESPGQVCGDCGFGDYANFFRAFKEAYGISPREFAAGRKEQL